MLIGKVFHIWQVEDGWEVRGPDDVLPVALCDSKDEAIEWCKENAEAADVSQICFWDRVVFAAEGD
jgi:hypothetical protein